ncbi:TonB-dependent receptor [Larkinella harenae]
MKNPDRISLFLIKLMKLSLLQVLLMAGLASFSFARDSKAQELLHKKVTIRIVDQDVKSTLKHLSRTAQVRFLYSSLLIQADRKVTLNAVDERLESVLNRLLLPLKINYKVEGRQIILVTAPSENSKPLLPDQSALPAPVDQTVAGQVTDDKGEPLPGVNVVEKGTSRGTTTDNNGAYRFQISNGNVVLVFSSIGFTTQEVTVGNRQTLNVRLEADTKTLGEIVVVGYGTQARRNVTGSVTKVDLKVTENLPNTNVAQSLRGRVAGVQFIDNGRPGQGGTILVRGRRSINASNDPLIVLDGIFFNGSLAEINPNDIESMEILKDASAAAIYGSRAANGVILITSKRGKSEKPTIRVNSYYGVSGWSNRIKLLTPERYLEKTLDYRRQNGQEADPTQVATYLQNTEAENYRNGRTINPWDEISQKAGIQSYDVSISGQSGRTNYLVSGAFVDERGLMLNDIAKRITLRSNLENRVTDWLTVGVNATYARRDLSGADVAINWGSMLSPYAKMYYDDAQTDPVRFPQDAQLVPNPIFNTLRRQNEEVYHNLFSNFYATINFPFLKGLSYRINYSPNYRWQHNYTFEPAYQRNGDNILANVTKFNREDFDWVLENIVTYSRQFGQDHSLDATLLYGRNHFGWESTTATASNLFNGANGWNNLGIAQTQQTQSNASAIEGISSMLRLNYHFKNRYLLTLTARRDGSSVFGANNKYATFPSAALAWIASDEAFMKSLTFIDLLKVRLSHGSVGNQAISPFQSLSRSGTNQYVFGDGSATYTGTFPSGMANTSLKWETTTSTNAAVDFEVLKGRIGGTLEYYNMNTKNLLLLRSLPSATGFASVITNLGATNNRGFELTLNALAMQRGAFEWNANVVFSTNRNRIVHIYNRDLNKDGREDDDLGNRWFIGQPVQVAFDYVIDGVYQDGEQLPTGYKPGFYRLKDINNDGKITTDDRTIIGQLEPKYRWGFTNSFRYGNFSLTVFLNSMQGWIKNYNQMIPSNNYPGSAANFPDNGWWTPENRSNTMASLVYTNPYGHSYYVSRNFVRVQDVALAYEFPKNLLNRWKMGSIRAYISGKNLLTFTNYPGFDPEIGSEASGYPMPRSFTGGLNLSF